MGQSTLVGSSGVTQAEWQFHTVWCSWANQCGGADYGDGYWLVSQNCYNSACATPGTAGDSCTFDPPHCGDHCYDSDAMWNVWYTEYYEGTYACDCSSSDLTYFGPGCPGHW
jgi:hypothetical protein